MLIAKSTPSAAEYLKTLIRPIKFGQGYQVASAQPMPEIIPRLAHRS